MEIFRKVPQIDFMAMRKVTGVASIIACVASIIIIAVRGLNFGLDFTGGTLVEADALGYQ